MPSRTLPLPILGAAGALVIAFACADPNAPGSPVEPVAQLGKGGGGGGPGVTAASPAAAPPDVTLDVQVFGSGFDQGSNAVWIRSDPDSASLVQVNSTAYVSKSELRANITVPAGHVDADYDIEVTTSRGKKGLGAELFSVDQTASVAPTATVYITTSGSGAGIYHDGGPDAEPEDYPYSATFNESGDLWVSAGDPPRPYGGGSRCALRCGGRNL